MNAPTPPRIYLAGPDVFLPDPHTRAANLKSICAMHGLHGVSPLDDLADEPTTWAALPLARRIALRNEAHIAGAAALIANLTPFRGPSADAGTIFEIGFMRALGRPVFGWSNSARLFTDRTRAFLGPAATQDREGEWHDGEGLLIENFNLSDNLMIDAGIIASGGTLVAADEPRWTSLASFERCVTLVAQYLRANRPRG